MNKAHAVSLFNRAIAGLFAGSIFGLIVEVVLFGVQTGKFPMVGPMVGAILVAIVCGAVGDKEVSGNARLFAIALIAGVVCGVSLGVCVYVPWQVAHDPLSDTILRDKVHARYLQDAVPLGILFGGLGGLITATLIVLRKGMLSPGSTSIMMSPGENSR